MYLIKPSFILLQNIFQSTNCFINRLNRKNIAFKYFDSVLFPPTDSNSDVGCVIDQFYEISIVVTANN